MPDDADVQEVIPSPKVPKVPSKQPKAPKETPGIPKQELDDIVNQELKFTQQFPEEHAGIIDPLTGNVTLRKTGTSDAVTFTKSEIKGMNGKVMVHNHPGKSLNFSTDDIMFLSKHGLRETQVITDKAIVRMSRIEGGKVASPTQIRNTFNRRMKPVMKELVDKYRGKTISLDEASSMGIHRLWRSISKDLGLKYQRILL